MIVQGSDDIEVDQELVLILDDWRLDENVQIDEASFRKLHNWLHNSRFGNWFMINGWLQPQFPIYGGSRLRLRLINATNVRILRLKLESKKLNLKKIILKY